MKKIGILGTRGIPASYSGFETSVEETAVRFAKSGYDVTVFCRENHYKQKSDAYLGVHLLYVSSFKTKHLDTFSSLIFSLAKVKRENFDVVILYGVGNSYFIPLLKLFCKKIICVVDGADWERQKWGFFAKFFLREARYFASKFSDHYVVDNESLAKQYQVEFGKTPEFISYGAKIPVEYSEHILERLELDRGQYFVFIGRFVEEKKIDFLINNFERINTNHKLVIVGGNDTDIDYVKSIVQHASPKIIFPGFIYSTDYESLLRFAYSYVSCSQLEGTSPSLLSAMAINGFALVSDIKENVETLKGSCRTFAVNNSEDFITQMEFIIDNPDFVDRERRKTSKIVNEYYSWDTIAQKYIDLF